MFQNSSGENLRALLEELHLASFGWAISCCAHDRSEAEAVLQTVYLKVLEGRAHWKGLSSFKTWLFGVIRKTAMQRRRRNFLRKIRLIPYGKSHESIQTAETPEHSVYREQLQNLLRKALERLPRRQHEVLQLVFYHDFTIESAAEVMGVSLGSARTHYERGKKTLRERLKELRVFV